MLERLWGLTAGLLIGAGVFGHALRLVILPSDSFTPRHAVAGFAVLLYGVASYFVLQHRRAGLWIAVLGPLGGITAVTLAPSANIDTFQVVLGIPQFMAIGLSIYLLTQRDRPVA